MDVHDFEQQSAADMRAAQAGCRIAYTRLLTAVSASFRRIAAAEIRRLGLTPHDADDVLQEILLAVHLKRHTWRPDRPFTPWLRAIARHKAVDFVRRRRRAERSIEDFPDVFAAPAPEPGLEATNIERLLVALPRRQRAVIEEVALGGASVAEAASKLQMSHGAVYVAFHRALATLRAALERLSHEGPGTRPAVGVEP
jgi:RNA polymerase sigma-70 factor (ECF subfamily)